MGTSAALSRSQYDLPEVGKPHMKNGRGFHRYTAKRALVERRDADAFQGTKKAHFSATPDASRVLLGCPEWELGML
jgi:hypothetical protein